METVPVPRPGPNAFQKNRPLSDLIKAQIKHFQHIEATLPVDLRGRFLPHEITSEAAAAEYIAHMTGLLQDRGKVKRGRVQEMPRRDTPQPGRVKRIAATTEETAPSGKRSSGQNKKPATRTRKGSKS